MAYTPLKGKCKSILSRFMAKDLFFHLSYIGYAIIKYGMNIIPKWPPDREKATNEGI